MYSRLRLQSISAIASAKSKDEEILQIQVLAKYGLNKYQQSQLV